DEAGVAEHGPDLVVAGHDPRLQAPMLGDPVDGGGLPQLQEERIGIGEERAVVEVQRHRLGHRYVCTVFNMRATRAAGEQTRRSFLDAATRLFCERGLRAVSLSDIAAEVGAFPSHVTYYF